MRIAALLLLLALFTPWERAARLAGLGDLAGAEREYRALLAEEPGDGDALYNLGTILLLQGRHDEARPHLEAARSGDLEEPRADAPYNLGNTDLEPAFTDSLLPDRDTRLRRAIEAYKRTLLADPDDDDAKWNLELARRLLERDSPPPDAGGGGGGGGEGPPQPGETRPSPLPDGGAGPQPDVDETEAESLLRAARERELEVQRDRLRKPQPPGTMRP